MHITIPDQEELIGANGKKFVSYNVHINGTYHCSARFSILSKLHDRLKKQFGQGCLEKFPEKSMFYVKPEQAALRRYQLQRWLQKIGANALLVKGEHFQNFLLNAQKEVQKGPEEDVQLEIFLAHGRSVKVDIMSTDQTDDVLETAMSAIGLDPSYVYYFGLYLVEDNTGKVIVRKLQDFESPFVSLARAEKGQIVQMRKAYWDPRVDQELHKDPIALNLLYIETINEIKKGSIEVEDDAAEDLANFRSQKDRLAFLGLASTLKGYGDQSFGSAYTNYPKPNTMAKLALGNSVFKIQTNDGHEHTFQVQRMRCWKTCTIESGAGIPDIDGKKVTVEFEFEYFLEKTAKMQWIKVLSPQSIHISMCLQFLVEEMLRLKKGAAIRKPSDRVGAFKPRRQKAGGGIDMDFLTGDGGGAATVDNSSILGGPTIKISVTLSELQKRVAAFEAEDESALVEIESLVQADMTASGAIGGEEDDNGGDDRNAFASMAGF